MIALAPPIVDTGPDLVWADAGNARRLLHLFGDSIRYVPEWDSWLTWNGKSWDRDSGGLQLLQMAEATCNQMIRDAANIRDHEKKQAYVEYALRCFNATRLREMIFLARSGAILPAAFCDRDKFLLNCANGTLDLQTLTLRPHDPADYLTRCLDVEYHPDALAPTWERFLAAILPSPDVRAYVQKAIGYSLTGATKEQCFFFAFGGGQNGKSTFFSTLLKLLASYVQKSQVETFMESDKRRGAGSASPDLAALKTARLVLGSEVDKGMVFNEGRIKDMTGEEQITCRELYERQFSYLPQYKLWLYGNHKPVIKSQDPGIRRRVRLIPFTVRIPDEQKDPDLAAKLERELPGVLAWAVQGCAAWQKNGLHTPAEIVQATGKYLDSMDYLAPFFAEYCYFSPDASVSRKRLWETYKSWSADEDEQVFDTATRFSREIGDRFEWEWRKDGKGERYWQGVGLLIDQPPEAPTASIPQRQESCQAEQEQEAPPVLEELSLVCSLCGAEVERYGPDGTAYCAVHEPVETPAPASPQIDPISRPAVSSPFVLRRQYKEMAGAAPKLDDLSEEQQQKWFARPGQPLPAPETMTSAWYALQTGIAKRFPGCHLLKTPRETGLALIERSLPRDRQNQPYEYPPLAPDLAKIIHDHSTQHRMEAYHPAGTLAEQVLLYDARVAHAKFLRDLPVAWDVWHDNEPIYLRKGEISFRRGFYKVDFSIPRDWAHLGLVPVPGEGYPRKPGASYVAWLNWREVALLKEQNWPYEVQERILFALDGEAGADPLRHFSDRMRESLEALDKLQQTAAVKAVRAGLRAVVLHAIGSFNRQGKENPQTFERLADVPEDAPEIERAPDGRYLAKFPSGLSKYEARWYRPEWAADIWAGTRSHTTRKALSIPFRDLYVIDGDGLYIGCDPTIYSDQWADDGHIGTHRLQQTWKPDKPYKLPVTGVQVAWFRELKKGK